MSLRLGGSGGAPSRGGIRGASGCWRTGDSSPVPLNDGSRFFTRGGRGGGLSTTTGATDCSVTVVDCEKFENPLDNDPETENGRQ